MLLGCHQSSQNVRRLRDPIRARHIGLSHGRKCKVARAGLRMEAYGGYGGRRRRLALLALPEKKVAVKRWLLGRSSGQGSAPSLASRAIHPCEMFRLSAAARRRCSLARSTTTMRAASKPSARDRSVATIRGADLAQLRRQSSDSMVRCDGLGCGWQRQSTAGLSPSEPRSRRRIGGRHYSIVVENNTGQRFEMVASVDGQDVVDGRSASLEKRGYVVDAFHRVRIDGFRTSMTDVAAFRFGSVRNSMPPARRNLVIATSV